MPKVKASTIRYVAKQGYQLCLMRGITNGRICGLHYFVFFAADTAEEARQGVKHAKVKVYKDKELGLLEDVTIKCPKSWRELI